MSEREVRQIMFTAKEQAELLVVDGPPGLLKPNEVEGHTLASLISAGTELAYGYTGDSFPAGSGYAAVFEIDAVGDAVENLNPGDRTIGLGPHRSWQRMAARDVVRLPEDLSATDATFARMAMVSMSTLVTTTARPPGLVVVTGLGPIGHIAAQVFNTCGYQVIAVDPDAHRRGLAELKGLKRVFPSITLDDPDVAGKVDLVVECSGHEQAILDGCKVVRPRGEVVLIGVPWRSHTDISAHALVHAVFHNYVVLRSGWEWELPHQATDFRQGSLFANLGSALEWLDSGRISVEGLYQTMPPAKAQQAYQNLLNRKCNTLTIVFDWTA